LFSLSSNSQTATGGRGHSFLHWGGKCMPQGFPCGVFAARGCPPAAKQSLRPHLARRGGKPWAADSPQGNPCACPIPPHGGGEGLPQPWPVWGLQVQGEGDTWKLPRPTWKLSFPCTILMVGICYYLDCHKMHHKLMTDAMNIAITSYEKASTMLDVNKLEPNIIPAVHKV
jgi:hypothetical protein